MNPSGSAVALFVVLLLAVASQALPEAAPASRPLPESDQQPADQPRRVKSKDVAFPEQGVRAYYKDFPEDGKADRDGDGEPDFDFDHVFTRIEYIGPKQLKIERQICRRSDRYWDEYDDFNRRLTFKLCFWEFTTPRMRAWFIDRYGRDWNTTSLWAKSDLR